MQSNKSLRMLGSMDKTKSLLMRILIISASLQRSLFQTVFKDILLYIRTKYILEGLC